MIWPVTILATLLGLVLFSIPGALLGLLLGVLADRHLAIPGWRALWLRLRGHANNKTIPTDSLHFMLLGHLAKLNGRVLPVHIKQASLEMQRLQLGGYAQQAAINAFSRGKNMSVTSLADMLHNSKLTSEQAEKLISSCWRLVWAERKVSQQQRQTIFDCGKWLGLVAGRVAALEMPARPASDRPRVRGNSSELAAALALLGLPAATRDWNTIERSYRRQLSANHPDKLIGRGATAAQVEAANQQTQKLHRAYSILRQHLQRG